MGTEGSKDGDRRTSCSPSSWTKDDPQRDAVLIPASKILISRCSGLPNEDSLPPSHEAGPVPAPPARRVLRGPHAFGCQQCLEGGRPKQSKSFSVLSAGSFAPPSLGHGLAEMLRVALSCLFVWAASQAVSSRNNRIFSFVRVGKIKHDLNSLLELHQMSPPGHELSGSQGEAALPSTGGTFPNTAAQAMYPRDHPGSFPSLATRRLPVLPDTEEAGGLCPMLSSTCGKSKSTPVCAQGCTSSTYTPSLSPPSQGSSGVPHSTNWDRAHLVTSTLGQLQDHRGLLGQLQEEHSASFKHKAHLAKRPMVASRSPRLPPLG